MSRRALLRDQREAVRCGHEAMRPGRSRRSSGVAHPIQADGGANVYVSGIPEEVEEEELLECFKVAGLFKLDAESGLPKLKM